MFLARIRGREIVLVLGDMTHFVADAITNATDVWLSGSGGLDAAIHQAGGPSLVQECRAIGHCATGNAVVTRGGTLPAPFVIHAVGPVWWGGDLRERELLAWTYRNVLARAEELGVMSLAMPSIATGAFGFPVDMAAHIAVRTVAAQLRRKTPLTRVTFVLYDEATYGSYEKACGEVLQNGRQSPAPKPGPSHGGRRKTRASELRGLHPHVLHVAEPLFADGYYRQAVLDTFIALILRVRAESGHPADGTALMQKVFSKDDPVLCVSPSKDEQLGYQWLFSGAVMAIRNPGAHSLEPINDPQQAVEWLSFASALHRTLDRCTHASLPARALA